MKNNTLGFYWLLGVFMLFFSAVIIFGGSTAEAQTAYPTTNNVTTWDDPEYGTRCYILNDIAISCVAVESVETDLPEFLNGTVQ